MIRRSTWILLAVFATLAAGTLIWQRTEKKNGADPTPTSRPALFDFESGSIIQVQLANSSQSAVFDKQADGSWILNGDPSLSIDSDEISNRLAQLTGVRALNVIDAPPQESLTGMDEPILSLSMVLENGRTILVEVGASTAIGSGYYTRLDGARLYVVSKSVLDGMLTMLQAPPLQTPQADAAQTPDPFSTPLP